MNKSILLAAVMTTIVLAEAPRTMLFQGSVSKKGVPLTGMHNVVIDICTGKTAEQKDCAALYPKKALEFKQGYYSVVLGEEIPLPVFDKQYYLEVYIDGTVSMERIPLTSTPSALNAIRADSAKYAESAKSADVATRMTNITSKKDSTIFSDGVLSFDDTVSFVSQSSNKVPLGSSFMTMMNNADSSFFKISSETKTAASHYRSNLVLSEDRALLMTYGELPNGSSGASLEIKRGGNTEISTDTLDMSRGYSVIHVPVIKFKSAYTSGPYGDRPNCTEELEGTIIYDSGVSGGGSYFRGCVRNPAGSTNSYSWEPLNEFP